MIIEVTRGDMVESRHRADIAIVDADGKVVRAWGDIEPPVYGRSAIKPLQALPLERSRRSLRRQRGGDRARLRLHNGEPRHVELVTAWPRASAAACRSRMRQPRAPYRKRASGADPGGRKPDATYNNCSGKHAGFLSTARHLGEPTSSHPLRTPVQQRILGVIGRWPTSLGDAPRGIDGAAYPSWHTRKHGAGHGAARRSRRSPAAGAPAASILAAMAAEPFLVAGTGRFCTKVMEVVGTKVALKTGAEGVYAAALPTFGLGVALKVEDGAGRAAEVAMGRVLQELELLTADEEKALADTLTPPIRNRVGRETGRIRPAAAGPPDRSAMRALLCTEFAGPIDWRSATCRRRRQTRAGADRGQSPPASASPTC
jgi:L-asparaginase II